MLISDNVEHGYHISKNKVSYVDNKALHHFYHLTELSHVVNQQKEIYVLLPKADIFLNYKLIFIFEKLSGSSCNLSLTSTVK